MIKRMLALWLVVLSTAVFAILYPEYILLSGTYEYIIEEDLFDPDMKYEEHAETELLQLLHAEPQQVRVSSKLMQYLTEEGMITWKNKS